MNFDLFTAKFQSGLRNEPVDGRRAARAQAAGGPAGGVRDPPDVGTSSTPPRAPATDAECAAAEAEGGDNY